MRPDVTALTERIYAGLPELYRQADLAQADGPSGFPLLRYLSAITDPLARFEVLLDRLTRTVSETGEVTAPAALTDPMTADLSWLPWLGQLVGVTVDRRQSELEQRDAVRFASAGYRAGTKASVADAARSALTGARYVKVHDHSVSEPGNGGPWDVLLVTRVSDTPDVAAVLDAVVRRGAKPAGVRLRHRTYSATFTETRAVSGGTFAARQLRFPTFRAATDHLPEGA